SKKVSPTSNPSRKPASNLLRWRGKHDPLGRHLKGLRRGMTDHFQITFVAERGLLVVARDFTQQKRVALLFEDERKLGNIPVIKKGSPFFAKVLAQTVAEHFRTGRPFRIFHRAILWQRRRARRGPNIKLNQTTFNRAVVQD